MYKDYFQLKENPFALTPDPRFLYLSHHHREALAHLLYGMGEMGGFVQVTGEVGTGKTTLCRSLLDQTPELVDVALILNSKLNGVELVASICDELKVDYPADTNSVKVLVDCLNRHLLATHAAGRRTVLVIDEAQNLSPEVLEQVRLLTNLETTTHKLLQILLLGQPELKALMEKPELRQLSQRITARYHLTPLRMEETVAYVYHRLDVVGCHRPLFTPSALRLVHRLSGGVPRLINIICDRGLLGAYARRKLQVDRALIRVAAGEVTGEPVMPRRRIPQWLAAAGVCCLVVIGGWAMLTQVGRKDVKTIQDTVPRTLAQPSTPMPAAEAKPLPAAPEEQVVPDNIAPVPMPEAAAETAAQAQAIADDSAPSPVASTTSAAVDDGALPALAPEIRAESPSAPLTLETVTILPDNREPESFAPETAPGSPDDEQVRPLFVDLLKGGQVATDTESAFGTLFRHWQVDPKQLAGDTACQRAKTIGLKCLYDSGNWNTLTNYNRPAVLELVDDERRLHDVVLVGIQGNEVVLDFSGEPAVFARSEIEPYWFGEFILFWKASPTAVTVLGKGSRGPEVQRLRYWLDRAEGGASKPQNSYSGIFDNALEQRVIRFQRHHRVTADGLVGEKTWLLLNTAAGDPPQPVLQPPTG